MSSHAYWISGLCDGTFKVPTFSCGSFVMLAGWVRYSTTFLTAESRTPRQALASHLSTSTRQELHACPGEVGVMYRLDVRMLMQPARSGESPSAPVGA
jgi:hypothetical protein